MSESTRAAQLGALGLAVLVTIATAAARGQTPGTPLPDALTHGYTTGLVVGGAFHLAALIVAALTIRTPEADAERAPM